MVVFGLCEDMAITEYFSASSGNLGGGKVGELKRELQRILDSIPDEDEEFVDEKVFNRMENTVQDLKKLKVKKKITTTTPIKTTTRVDGAPEIPEYFICPMSHQLMKDPVILSSGQTFERSIAENWIKTGHQTCPRTHQVLCHSILTPNYLVRKLIQQWCESQGIELPSSKNNDNDSFREVITEKDRMKLDDLLTKIVGCNIEGQRQAAKEFRALTKKMPSFRVLLGENENAILILCVALSQTDYVSNPGLQEDLVTTMLNLSIHEENKKKLVEMAPEAISLLVNALSNGQMETNRNAAAALFSLSAVDENKVTIAEAGALKPLILLLEKGTPMAKKDAASAIFNICKINENRARAVDAGVVKVLIKHITEEDSEVLDFSLSIIALISGSERAVEEIVKHKGVQCLLKIIRDGKSNCNCENAIATLYFVVLHDRSQLKEIHEEENEHKTIAILAEVGTPRARRKATSILGRLRRSGAVTA